MSKINLLRIALKSGSFWRAFARRQPVQSSDFIGFDHTPSKRELQEKCEELWDKYVNLKRKYLDGAIWVSPQSSKYRRLMALYEAHHRDLLRLHLKYPSW
jgi:hypothetical protein